ncbi:MAG: NAD(P)-binding domain-containing protein [Acidobacteria bacterium]|nr:NAD(P)-binding domain-containing protein [Acidobacteriota bacterium]
MTEALSRFIVKRKDGVVAIDELVIDSEGLTIGRLIQNDLALNHPAVSRLHAGIKQIGKDFWINNLSESNGTLLNGELVERTPLAEGDLIQIGPFLLKVNYGNTALYLTVEREIEVTPIIAQTNIPMPSTGNGGEENMKTLMVNIPARNAKPIVTPGGTQRLQGTGRLSTFLNGADEQALKVFWAKRKREEGKLAEKTPLHPKGARKIGKAQFNWKPTLDLRKLWRKSYWVWGAGVVLVLALVAVFIRPNTFAPDPVADAHAKTDVSKRGIALRPNANSCTECHNVISGVQNKCIDCHNTAGSTIAATSQNPKGFSPQTLIAGHQKANVTACNQCHTEHQGRASAQGLLNYSLCVNCHNGNYAIEDGPKKGEKLAVPHGGGSVGLPQLGVEFKWPGWNAARWQRALDRWETKDLQQAFTPQKLEKVQPVGYVKTDQFHYLHYLGKVADEKACVVCHKDNRLDAKSAEGIKSLREACLKCHATTDPTTGLKANLANCITCHKQHPNEGQLATRAEVAATQGAQNLRDVSKFLNSVDEAKITNKNGREMLVAFKGLGSASAIRQDKDLPRLALDSDFGAVPWYGWVAAVFTFPTLALVGLIIGTSRRKALLKARIDIQQEAAAEAAKGSKAAGKWEKLKESWLETANIDLDKLKAKGPAHPYPLVNPKTCIGCHACVEACPHDVLKIVEGIAVPVAPDQCMEDTACQVECPTNPKSCIVINTNKVIPARKVPERDTRFKTNVEGIYLIGDVSGVPLIKNAINEGGAVVESIVEDLQREGANSAAEYDVAIIGIGPAGLSAAVLAQQRGLRYVAVEQDKIVATIQQTYPAGKYVFFKPDTVDTKGGIPLPGVGDKKENMLQGWFDAMMKNNVIIHEEESCKDIKLEKGIFTVKCERGSLQEKVSYKTRKVIIAIGNRGTPLKLGVKGEDLKIKVQPPPVLAKFCNKCGNPRRDVQKFCNQCGEKFALRNSSPVEDSKVKYRLTDPDEYVKKKCIVVGAGNSAIESAVDLTGLKRDGDNITFTRNNEVTLVIRSDFKGDLKLGNKINVYDCMDAGKIKVFFRTQIKEISETEVVLMDSKGVEKARLANDYIFALIGGDRPTKFLESIGIKIGGE